MDLVTAINSFYYHMAICELQMMNESDRFQKLSYNSILYLNVIWETPSCTASKLAEILKVSKPAATLKVNELVKQGALEKTQSETDKRVFYLKLTQETEKTIKMYDTVFAKIGEKLEGKYTTEQVSLFAEILHSISTYNWSTINNE